MGRRERGNATSESARVSSRSTTESVKRSRFLTEKEASMPTNEMRAKDVLSAQEMTRIVSEMAAAGDVRRTELAQARRRRWRRSSISAVIEAKHKHRRGAHCSPPSRAQAGG
jgi:hypothetical protein